MGLQWFNPDKFAVINDVYWHHVFDKEDPRQENDNWLNLTDTPASQPVFGEPSYNLSWNAIGNENGKTGIIGARFDNRNGGLGDPATETLRAQYDVTHGFSTSFSKSESVTKAFDVGVGLKFLDAESETSFGIAGTTTYGSGTTDNHVTTTSQNETFDFTIPKGKAYEAQLWHSVEKVEVPFTINLHITGWSTVSPLGPPQPIDEGRKTLETPIGHIFRWAHNQGPSGPAGDDYVNYQQDPTNPSAGIYVLHGKLEAYSGGAFYAQVVDAVTPNASDPAPPSFTRNVSVQQFSPSSAVAADAGASGQDEGDASSPSNLGLPDLGIVDPFVIDGMEKAFWQSHFGTQYVWQFENWRDLNIPADGISDLKFGDPKYTPTAVNPPFYAIVNNINGLQEDLALGTVLTYSVQDGHEATQSTGGSVTKNFEQKVSVDFGEFGNAHADFKLDDTVSWDKSTTGSKTTTETYSVGTDVNPIRVSAAPGEAKQLQVTHTQEAIEVPYWTTVRVTGNIMAHTRNFNDQPNGPDQHASIGDLFAWVHDQGPNGPAGPDHVLYSRDPQNPNDGLLTLNGKATVYSGENADLYAVSAEFLTDKILHNPTEFPPTGPLQPLPPTLPTLQASDL